MFLPLSFRKPLIIQSQFNIRQHSIILFYKTFMAIHGSCFMLQKSLSGSSCGLPNEAHCTTCYCLLSGLDLLWSPGISLGLIDNNIKTFRKLIPQCSQGLSSPRGLLKWGLPLDKELRQYS